MQDIVDFLESRGHVLDESGGMAVVSGVSKLADGRLYASFDKRADGGIDGF